MTSAFAQQLYRDIEQFMSAPVLPFEPVRGKNRPSAVIANNSSLSLVQYMTENEEAEKRAQDALFPFLLDRYKKVERERQQICSGVVRQFDFYIEHQGAGIEQSEIVIIELKHLSPHQSGRFPAPRRFANLLGPIVSPAGKVIDSLASDLNKPRPPGATLIQIGLFTGFDALGGHPPREVDNYFIRTYVDQARPSSTYKTASENELQAWALRTRYTCPVNVASGNDYHDGTPCTFQTLAGISVTGRVNYFMGIVTDPDDQPASGSAGAGVVAPED